MGDTRKAVRLSSKELFIYYHKGHEDIPVRGCTNKRVLSRETGVDYNTLMKVFTRKLRCFYENDKLVILKLYTSAITKGGQSIERKGIGGMEKFARYIVRKNY